MPGGVSSPVRAFRAVGGTPPVIAKGNGATIIDLDGNEYIDYVCSWGALILGHADDRVVAAVGKAAAKGCSFGALSEGEIRLAELIVSRIPAAQMIRLVNSGTEAVMSAVRLARGFTGRDRIVKFKGCYHGHVDALLAAAGSGPMTLGTPVSPGVPSGAAGDTYVLPYNDLAAVKRVLDADGPAIAAVIVEPVAANMGLVPPADGFLPGLRTLCDEHGALLVFDEVVTGFRVSSGGAGAHFGVVPDLVCVGKVVGGGLPLAAYGGRRDVMEHVSPAGKVYQAGTLSGNPLAAAAGIATLQATAESGFYDTIDAATLRLHEGLRAAAAEVGVTAQPVYLASLLCTFFSDAPPTEHASVKRSDTVRFAKFFHAMLERGVYLPPSQFECWFVSAAHTDDHIDRTIDASREAFRIAAG